MSVVCTIDEQTWWFSCDLSSPVAPNLVSFQVTHAMSVHHLVKYRLSALFRGFTYYKMSNLDNRIANADHLLTQDVEKLCTSIGDLYSNLSKVGHTSREPYQFPEPLLCAIFNHLILSTDSDTKRWKPVVIGEHPKCTKYLMTKPV